MRSDQRIVDIQFEMLRRNEARTIRGKGSTRTLGM
jgi:hypothetical protein